MTSKRLILQTLLTAVLIPICALAEDKTSGLLRDDFVISGADGKLINGGGDNKWLFEFEEEQSDGKAVLKAGEPLELLKSAALEKMVEDARERKDARYRLWGKVTKFEGKNFIFATYFLPLRKLEDRGQKTEDGRGKTGDRGQMINSPNDVLKIPDEIAAKLQTSEVLPADETQQTQMQLKQDTIFANRTGFVIGGNGKYVFVPDGLGRGIEGLAIELLPCRKLEEAIAEIKSEPNPVRFNVAGILTRYEGRQYLLLQKAARTYSYGNFGR